MNKTQAQALARNLATTLSVEDEAWVVLEARSGEAWVVGEFVEGDTWEQNGTSDFAICESRNAPGVWCVVEYDEDTPVLCHTSSEACFPLA